MNTSLCLLLSSIAFFILFLMWKKENMLNFIIKVVLFILALADAFAYLQVAGYVFKK